MDIFNQKLNDKDALINQLEFDKNILKEDLLNIQEKLELKN